MTPNSDDPTLPFRVIVVCLGNICRSPMAASVLASRVTAAGMAEVVQVSSAGTAGWHVGEPADRRARDALRRNGYDDDHSAQRFGPGHAHRYDLVLAMDTNNHSDLSPLVADSEAQLRMFREFDPNFSHIRGPDPRLDVPDPYYGPDAGFDDVLAMIESAADGLVEHLRTHVQQT